jgi:hypothetical protein
MCVGAEDPLTVLLTTLPLLAPLPPLPLSPLPPPPPALPPALPPPAILRKRLSSLFSSELGSLALASLSGPRLKGAAGGLCRSGTISDAASDFMAARYLPATTTDRSQEQIVVVPTTHRQHSSSRLSIYM